MSIGHHHVFIVYSLMEHMTWKSPGPMSAHRCLLLSCPLQELLQLLCRRDSQEVRSEDQGTQERNGLFHSWYTDPSLQGKREQCNSQVAITDHAVQENHVIDWDKAKVVDREAQRQNRWIKEALWMRKTPTCMNRYGGSYKLSYTGHVLHQAVNNQDVIKMSDGHRNIVIR